MSSIDKITEHVKNKFMPGKSEDKVIEAAKQVFLRYGYKRVTMADIAEAARMSRPALYLVFPSKEEIFKALLARVFTATLDEIRQGLSRTATVKEQLIFAFDIWGVRPFEMMLASPDAKDLYESSYQFATEVMVKTTSDFIALIAEVIDPLVRRQSDVNLSSVHIARIMTSAVPGFKGSATTTDELRELIGGLIMVVLASIGHSRETEKPGKRSRR
jgi:AcrR family transcriptional regulator